MQDDMNPVEPGQPLPESAPEPASTPQEPEKPTSRKALWLAMGAVALALGLIWVAPGIEPHVDDAGVQADYPGEPEDAEAAGKPAKLDFTLKDMHGVDVHLASFKGKVIVLNFWATWC